MRWKLAALLLILSMSLVAASSLDIAPKEFSSIKIYDSRPLKRVPPPVMSGDRIYVVGGQGDTLMALDLQGKKLWSVRVGARISAPPLVIPDAFYGYSKKESWIVVVTDSFELRAFNSAAGELRIERLRLPSRPSGSPMLYLNDGRTVVIPLASSLQAVDLRTKSTNWAIDLGFKLKRVNYLGDKALILGDHDAALVSLKDRRVIWSIDLGERILASGGDQSLVGIVLQNGTMISLKVETGELVASRDVSPILGYDIPNGTFPVLDGTAALTSSREAIIFLNLSDLTASRPLKTWIPPAIQPVAVGKALLYFSKSGVIRVYHYTGRFLLYEFDVSKPPLSRVVYARRGNHTSILSYVDLDGSLHLIELPDHWIKIQRTENVDGGILVEGFICSTAPNGSRVKVVLYTMSTEGEVTGSKVIGFLSPGRCGARFSTLLKGKGALGLILDDETLPPNVPIGLTREEWMSLAGGGATVTTSTSTTTGPTTTSSMPAVKPMMTIQVPSSLTVGDRLSLKISGVNVWNVPELTFVLRGPTVREEQIIKKISPGSKFTVLLESQAVNPGSGASLVIKHGSDVLYEKRVPLKVVTGRVIERVNAPSKAKVNETMILTVKLVNRYREGVQFILAASLDGSSVERKVNPLKAGDSSEVPIKLIPRKEGKLQLRIRVLVSDKVVDERISTIQVSPVPQLPQQAPSPTGRSALPIPFEYVVGVAVGAVILVIAVAILAGSRKPKEIRMREMPEETPTPEPTMEGTEISPLEAPSGMPALRPPELEEETPEIPKLMPEETPVEMRRADASAGEIVKENAPPPIPEPEMEEIPVTKPAPEERPAVSKGEKGPVERELESLKRRLDRVRKSISRLEEIVGFELSPYRLVDAETSLVSAELKLKEGDVEEARKIVESVRESLDVLEAEVAEAEKVFLENWSAVENRIDIMLRVWGKAPANMLTMVPAGFRIHALERFRKLHPERKLELRGDELVSLEE